jgi:glutamate--cysteine ligase
MMYRTATVQVNLDFSDEADMVKKLRVSLALQPLATAIFASSPFTEGRPNGMRSMRSEIWRDTDRDRSGMLAFAFEDGMGFERYVDHALGVPMYFVYRDGRYIDVAGASFRDFLDGRLEALPGEIPTLEDWSDHLTTLFPEVRLKRFLEMRGADAQLTSGICALSAFWVGLLYDSDALDAAWDIVKTWSTEERQALRDQVPATALATPFRGGTLQDIAIQALAISHHGLDRRARLDAEDRNESRLLQPIDSIVAEGRTVADRLLALYEGKWGGDISPVFEEQAFERC